MESLRLGEIVTISKGKKHEIVSSIPTAKSKRYIQIEDLRNEFNLKYTNQNGVEVNKNDVIIAWDGANAGTIGFNLDGYIGSTLARLRIVNNNFDPNFLGWLLKGKFEFLRSQCTGATIPHISKQVLEAISIPSLSLNEQRNIAFILKQVDLVVAKRRQAIYYTEQFLSSAFIDIFGDPILNKNKWEVSEFGNCIDFLTSGSRGWAKYYSEEGDLFIRIENIGRSTLFLDENKLQYVKAPANTESKRTKIREGDLLISITADLGRSAVVPKLKHDAYINQHLALTRLKKGINPIYITHLFSSQFGQSQFQAKNKGGVKAGLNFDDIKTLKIFLPPIDLQNRFSNLVSNVDSLLIKQKESKYEIETLFKSLMQQYFN